MKLFFKNNINATNRMADQQHSPDNLLFHPHFTVRMPYNQKTSSHNILQKTVSSPAILYQDTLQKTTSSPAILSRTYSNARIIQDVSTIVSLKAKSMKLESQNLLQQKVKTAKEKLALSRINLAKYSITDNSSSKIAAQEAYSLMEKEVEDACKAWCYARRS